jgi:hypothetical protein
VASVAAAGLILSERRLCNWSIAHRRGIWDQTRAEHYFTTAQSAMSTDGELDTILPMTQRPLSLESFLHLSSGSLKHDIYNFSHMPTSVGEDFLIPMRA